MRRQRNDDYADDYTPATDLVFSMFAMSVLLLALFGADGQLKTSAFQTQIALERLKTKKAGPTVTAPVTTPAPAPAVVSAPGPAPAPPPPARESPAPLPSEDVFLGEIGGSQTEAFTDAANHLAPEVVPGILSEIANHARVIEGMKANHLVLQVATDLHFGSADRGSSWDETMMWSKDLMTAIEHTRLALACVFVEPLGDTHSAGALRQTTGQLDSGDGLRRLRTGASVFSKPGKALSSAAKMDRWIRIWVRRDPDSHCTAQTLLESVGAGARP